MDLKNAWTLSIVEDAAGVPYVAVVADNGASMDIMVVAHDAGDPDCVVMWLNAEAEAHENGGS